MRKLSRILRARIKNRWTFRFGLAAAVALVGFVVLTVSGAVMREVTQGGEKADVFTDAAELPDALLDSVRWRDDSPDLPRQMEPLTRDDIAQAWIRAWSQPDVIAQTDDISGLEAYFSASALDAMGSDVQRWRSQSIEQIGHELELTFYSEDGQVVGLTSHRSDFLYTQTVGSKQLPFHSEESFEAVLLLEDGNWRIQHWVRRDTKQSWFFEPWETKEITFETPLHGLNYYPAQTPFIDFLPGYNEQIIEQDMAQMQASGTDTVRIFLDFAILGGQYVDRAELAKIEHFMDTAADVDIAVIVTLFDGRTDHRATSWHGDAQHIRQIVATLGNHEALAMWDIKNEPDRDVGIHGVTVEQLYAWLRFVADEVREQDPQTPITIGWTTPEAMLAAPAIGDVVSFHFYESPDKLAAMLDEIEKKADGRPIVLSEFGLATWKSLVVGDDAKAQANYYEQIYEQIAPRLDGTVAWTLWDFAEAPPDAGRLPWRSGPQKNYGLIQSDGTEKPALEIYKQQAIG